MATFVREGNGLTASGDISTEEIDKLIAHGQELLESEAPRLLLDIRKAAQEGSSFIGAIAHLGAEARARSKTLIVRADGHLADMLVWAGLHRVVTLYVSNNTPAPSA
jgi:hypothetical protein